MVRVIFLGNALIRVGLAGLQGVDEVVPCEAGEGKTYYYEREENLEVAVRDLSVIVTCN